MASSGEPPLATLRARFEAGRGNLSALETLNDELRGYKSPVAVELQCEVMIEILALRAGAGRGQRPPTGPTTPGWLGGPRDEPDLVGRIRARAVRPDQPLYRYGVTDDEYAELRALLDHLHQRGGLEHANDRSAAAFVLYVSEWFRREYDGGGYSWESPYPALIGGLSDAARVTLARGGLAWWGRVPRRTAHGELRLMSLALEGGFPTRLLESRETGRIPLHLVHLLARVEGAGAVDEDRATELSRLIGEGLGTYNNEEFHALSAELVLAIASLKAEAAAAAPPGVAATAWLDAARPDWRDRLPIGLSGDGARRLLDDLVSARTLRIGAGDARARRLLLLDGGAWKPGLRLGVDGEIALKATRFRPADGRLRVHAAGALSAVFAGELSLIEAPTDDEQGWLCRRRGGRALEAALPFEQPVEVEVRGGGASETIVWPGGEPLRSELLLFADEIGDETGPAPTVLELVGRGSLRTRRPRLFCWAPVGFTARNIAGETPIAPFWQGSDFTLFELRAPARVGPPGGDDYRVEVGAGDEQAEQMLVDGRLTRGFESADPALTIYDGAPVLRVRRGSGRAAAAPHGEVHWRRIGGAVWRDWHSDPPQQGAIEVIWRDPNARALRDRQRFVVLPADIQITSRPNGRREVTVDMHAPAGWALSAAPSADFEVAPAAGGLGVRFTGRPLRRLPLVLTGPGFDPHAILVRARVGAGGFFRADGRMFGDRAAVMLEDLHGAVAYSEGHERLYLSGPQQGRSRLSFHDETPLWALSEEITRLLSGGSELDDKVVIEFGWGDGPRLTVGRYDITLGPVVDGLVSVKEDHSGATASTGRRLEWFSILEPGFRLIAEGDGPAQLPPDCLGPGVAVLRDGDRVVGRPTLAVGAAVQPESDWPALKAASTIANHTQRAEAIARAIAGLGEASPEAAVDRDHLRELIGNLGGLPPSSMDALKQLAAAPVALAALIATTTDEATLQAIWALERDLPFLWCMIPIATWLRAFDLQALTLTRLLKNQGLSDDSVGTIVNGSLADTAASLADLDPNLKTVLVYTGLVQGSATPHSLSQCANDRVARTADLIDDNDPRMRFPAVAGPPASCFRAADCEVRDHLPEFKFLPIHWEGVDAACAAALSAAGDGQLTLRQTLRVRQARAEEPISFTDAFAATLSRRAASQPLIV
ncbi:MAG TPA: STY4851/ECs_5259 family protein [Caulobacteraceae bacterium]|jgi:hypothetical protein